MYNKLSVEDIIINKREIKVKFSAKGAIAKYFNAPYSFNVAYSEDINNVPKGLAVIPFICNVLPIIWLLDATLELPELDHDFYNHINEIKAGYMKMYPMLKFGGKINATTTNCKQITPPCYHCDTATAMPAAAFFSGGVDAFATLIAHADEKPMLITLWGSDVKLDDTAGWAVVKEHTLQTARQFGVKPAFIKTNFRTFINDIELNRLVKLSGDNYWHGFQHGIGLIGHAGPLVWREGLKRLYIASSYTAGQHVTCASDPTIDNYVKMAGCETIHDQYEFDRQEKVDHICEYAKGVKEKPTLRVCWITSGGRNCCKCEKCLRTMFEIFATGQDPREYGFPYTSNDLRAARRTIISNYCGSSVPYWIAIRKRFQAVPSLQIPREIEWIRTIDFDKERRSIGFLCYRTAIFSKRPPGRIIRKLKRIFIK